MGNTAVYPAKVTKVNDTYIVEFADLPGCFSEGPTVELALKNAQTQLKTYLDSLMEAKEPIPLPTEGTDEYAYVVELTRQVCLP